MIIDMNNEESRKYWDEKIQRASAWTWLKSARHHYRLNKDYLDWHESEEAIKHYSPEEAAAKADSVRPKVDYWRAKVAHWEAIYNAL